MSSKRLSVLDAVFLHLETKETPMHVASLMTFKLPDDAPRDFVRSLVQAYRAPVPLSRPWNVKLIRVPFSGVAPAVAEDRGIDLDYHVQHAALPKPGGERELGELISYLHGQTLDRSRPLWTCHIIEGLEGKRFAIYIKIHHALTDGINGIRMVSRSLAQSPDGTWRAPWQAEMSPTQRVMRSKQGGGEPLRISQWPSIVRQAMHPIFNTQSAAAAPVMLPFQAPRTALNGPVTAARRVATQLLDLSRIQALAIKSNSSVNDVFLALCSSALRKHLSSQGALPNEALVAAVPISLREPGVDGGNAVGFLWANLGSELADPVDRLRAIRASMQASKNHLREMPQKARVYYTMLTMTPAIGAMLSGLGAKVRPPMNLTISNVPGPEQQLYLDGSELEAIYPISIPLQGQGLNITCISYAGFLAVGFTGSRDSLAKLQRIAVYTGEALDELESALHCDTDLVE